MTWNTTRRAVALVLLAQSAAVSLVYAKADPAGSGDLRSDAEAVPDRGR